VNFHGHHGLSNSTSVNYVSYLEAANAGAQPTLAMLLLLPIAQFKSTEEARAKAPANLNEHYTRVANTSDAKKHLTMLIDTLIWQYLPDMLQLLQLKGFGYKLPELPLLIQHDG
jgi:hypothetical protein